jgi:hypothetical protein
MIEGARFHSHPGKFHMSKLVFVLLLFASPSLAQTPNLAPAPPVDRVGSPVVCLPIGKTSKGDLVYSLDCRDIPIASGVNSEPEPVAPTAPPKPPEKLPENK